MNETASNDIEVRRWKVSDGTRQYTRTLDGRILMVSYSDGTVKLFWVP